MKAGKRDQSAAVDVNELDAVRRVFAHLATMYGAHCIEPQEILRTWNARTVGSLLEGENASSIAYALHYMKKAVTALEAFGVHEPDEDRFEHGWLNVRLAVDVEHPKALDVLGAMFAVLGLEAVSLPRRTLRDREVFSLEMTSTAASKILVGLLDEDAEELVLRADFSELEAAVSAGRPSKGNHDTITILITKTGSAMHWSERSAQ
jgi:hypothetical protein